MFGSANQVSHIISLLSTPYTYLVLFALGFFEGPIVSVVAGFLVALGFIELIPTYLILMVANLMGDTIFYSIGRFWFRHSYKKILPFFRVKIETIEKMKGVLKKNTGKTILFGKLSQICSLVLITAGLAKVPYGEFISLCFLIEIPKALLLLFIGYYFGNSVTNLTKAVDYTVVGFLAFTAVFIAIYFMMTRFSDREVKKL